MKMASSIPATNNNNNLPMAANNNNTTSDAQMNFNPSWMQSTAPPMQRSLSVRNNNNSNSINNSSISNATGNLNAKKMVSESDETCEPIFAKHSYGREDLLAMMGKNNSLKPPFGIKRCPFFVDTAQTPIILMPFTDTEMRLQQNMNSSKAMSSKKKTFSRIGGKDAAPATTQLKEQQENTPTHKNNSNAIGSSGGSGDVTAGSVTTAKEPPPPSNALKKSSSTSPSEKGTPTPPPTSAAAASAPAPTSAATPTTEYWCYLDPSGVQRGPFDTHQMQAWFSSGYFSDTLQVRRKEETTYITLGELFLVNGREAPFKVRPVVEPAAPVQKPLQQQTAATTTAFQPVQHRISPSDLIESITQRPHISPNLESVQRIWATTPLEEGAGMGGVAVSTGGRGSAPSVTPAAAVAPVSAVVATAPSNNSSGGGGVAGSSAFAPIGSGPNSTASMAMLQTKEMQILEEQRKLREKEELLRRDELERAERERRMRDMEGELKRQQEELARLAREKDAEFKQRYAQMAEYERKRRDELAGLELHKLREKEELLQRTELERAEKERRMRDMEVELIRQQEELGRRAREKDAEFEQRCAQMAEYERKRQEELAALEQRIRNEHLQQHLKLQQQQKHQQQVQQHQQQLIQQQHQQQKIQQQQQQIIQQPPPQPQQQPQPAVTEQRRGWQPVQLPKPAPIPPAITKPLPNGGGAVATAPKASVVGTNNKKQQKKQSSQQQQQNKQQQKEQVLPVEDKFTAWIIKRVKALNPSVDAEVFATFISGIDSPNEAEDYIVGYLGENKEVKEFHRDFLQKRIELRPRAHQQAAKDDLSRPAAALGINSEQPHHKGTGGGGGWGAVGCVTAAANNATAATTAGAATNATQNNKKKKGGLKGQKVVSSSSHQLSTNKFTVLDPATLGFRPASDPNRVNAGEIDSVPPVLGGGNKRR